METFLATARIGFESRRVVRGVRVVLALLLALLAAGPGLPAGLAGAAPAAQVTPVVTLVFDQGPFDVSAASPLQLGAINLHVRISTNVPIRGVSFGIAYDAAVVKIGSALSSPGSIANTGTLAVTTPNIFADFVTANPGQGYGTA